MKKQIHVLTDQGLYQIGSHMKIRKSMEDNAGFGYNKYR